MEYSEQKREEIPKFSSPEDELRYLRERVATIEQNTWSENTPTAKEAAISQTIHEYAKAAPAPEHYVESKEYEDVVGHIKSLEHREKMREFYGILAQKGVAEAIHYTRAMDNPHFEDDFHRVLVGFIKTGAIIPGLDKERELNKILRKTVYQVTLPFAGGKDEKVAVAEVISSMERFYTGMLSTLGASAPQSLSIEIAMENYSLDVVFYVAVPDEVKDMFLRQIFGVFPTASVKEDKGDYNVFNEFGKVSASVSVPMEHFAYPLTKLGENDADPIKVLLNSFAKVERDGEGAAVQIVLTPDTVNVASKLKSAIGKLRQGVDVKQALDIPLGLGGELRKTFTDLFRSAPSKQKEDERKHEQDLAKTAQRDQAIKLLEEKMEHQIISANIRIVASAATQERADHIRAALESAFQQFSRPQGNGIKFVPIERSKLEKFIYNYTYRIRNDDELFVLNLLEAATMFHFPSSLEAHEAPQLKAVKASSAPPPADLPKEGTLLGINRHRGEVHEVRLTKADRLRHLYVIGQTGTGKSSILKNMIVEDIKAGEGVCFIDPHGSDVQDILASVPKERIDDVIYFDPSYTPRPVGLNMLEYDLSKPEQKIFVVNEMFSIFKKLYAAGNPESMGPAFEQYFRNATMLVMEDPETGCTLLEIPRVLADKNFRQLKLSRCKNPIVVQFWREIAEKTSGESGLANMIPYITNKFDVFLANDIMRPIVAQEESSFNFRYIMDNRKIFLVNLAKGKLGDINANLIGLILVGKMLMAALSRVDSFGAKLPDFYLYIDEFQNITTDSISAILSEARKYGLSLNVAHQFIAQLDEDIKKAVFGNVGNMAAFRVGAEDAEFLESQFAPVFSAAELMKIENYNCYLKILVNGRPVPPFNLATLPPPKGNPEVVEQMKQLSYMRFGRDRKTVDDVIMKKYLSKGQESQPQSQASLVPRAVPPLPPQIPQQTMPQGDGRVPLAQVAFPSGPAHPVPPPPQAVMPQRPPAPPVVPPQISQQTVVVPPPIQPSPPPIVSSVSIPIAAPQSSVQEDPLPASSLGATHEPFVAAFTRSDIPMKPMIPNASQQPVPSPIQPITLRSSNEPIDIPWHQDGPASDFTVEDAVRGAMQALHSQGETG